jgi:hypothetical protein
MVPPTSKFIQGTGFPAWGPGGIYYVRLDPDVIVVRDVRARREVEDVPVVAVDASGTVIAVGREVEARLAQGSPAVSLRHPFAESAMVAIDADLAAAILRDLASRLRSVSWLPLMIRGMLIHPRSVSSDALDAKEQEAVVAIAKRAGARIALAWTGRTLTDAEVLDAIAPPAYRL